MKACQNDYLRLLESYEDRIRASQDPTAICSLLDEVQKFWLRRLGFIEKVIELLADGGQCMLLSGAIYLNYSSNEHYPYKTLGKHNLLHDSLLKLEYLYRAPENFINYGESREVFLKAFQDELLVLRNCGDHFLYAPIDILLSKHFKDKGDLLRKGFWDAISSLFEKEIRTEEDFVENFSDYDVIQRVLGEKAVNIVLDDHQDRSLSIAEKTEGYFSKQSVLGEALRGESDSRKFLTAMSAYVMQALDILLTGVALGVTPFIRFGTTFNYFLLISPAFTQDPTTKSTISKVIITFIVHHTLREDSFAGINFDEFSKKAFTADLMQVIIVELSTRDIDVTEGRIGEARKVIRDSLSSFLSEFESTTN